MPLSTRAALVCAVAWSATLVSTPALAQSQTTLYPGQSGAPLLAAIDADYSPLGTLGYGPARDSLYAYEQRTDGALCGVYTRFCVQLTPGADPSTDAFQKGVNAEHTWPQSRGAADEPARSDLHALFPAKANVNSARSNVPFNEIPDAEADGWYREASGQSSVPTVFVDEWSEKDNDHPDPAFAGRFEPRHDHKGDAARAVFYFRAVYPGQVSSYGSQPFFDVQAPDLIVWHYADPVDLDEYARSTWIAGLQGSPNPFVLDSTLARRAYDLSGVPGDPGSGGPGDPPGGPLWVNEIHYDNAGSDTGEGVEVAGPAGTDLSGWTLVLYNGAGGAAYRTVPLSGVVPDQMGGYGTFWVPASGLQNGGPDGLALLDPAGAVVQFLSYEGTLTATSGPASGTTSTDIGVAETSSTPVGFSLQLTDGGGPGGGSGGTEAADFAWQAPASASPGAPNAGQTLGGAAGVAWINEIHYDNSGSDRDEGVEIAGTAGLDLSGWSVVLYNGSTRAVYDTIELSGVIDDEAAGLGAVWFGRAGVQNGSPDGLALVDADGAVVQFLSYEGAFVAQGGPASGIASTDLGVSESGGTPRGYSLQLAGTGAAAADFAWAGPVQHTRGSVNRNQTFAAPGAREAVATEAVPAGLSVAVYPNPVRDRATVAVDLPEVAGVRAEVFDALGRRVATVEVGRLGAGFQSVALDLGAVPAGLYVVRVTAGSEVATQTLTVVR
ncbi:MAG: endonuclease [Bacteroidota bacterium]